jgi:hypothetical protein
MKLAKCWWVVMRCLGVPSNDKPGKRQGQRARCSLWRLPTKVNLRPCTQANLPLLLGALLVGLGVKDLFDRSQG